MTVRAGISILATVAVLVGSLVYLAGSVLRVQTFTAQTRLSVAAPQSNGLHAGSAVVYRGVPIGQVSDVSYAGGGAVKIDLGYDADYRIPVDTELVIENQSMLGETAIYFQPRTDSGPYIDGSASLTARIVEVPASVPELLGSAQTLLDQVDPSLVSRLVETLEQALEGTTGAVRALTPAAQVLAATMIYSEPALVKILRNSSTMMADGAWIGPALRPTKKELRVAGKHLRDVITHVKPFADFTDGGRVIAERWKPALEKSAATVGLLVPPIGRLAQVLTPAAQESGAAMLGTLNVATLLTAAMQALPGDALRLSVDLPK
ncbi:MlaD family protein [Gordonia sp. VNK21]|uniref:MlaD family protein n=1 Tax=Gordonia sp. VNK21 TaxID=3382483 RepID=UPI0038D395A1